MQHVHVCIGNHSFALFAAHAYMNDDPLYPLHNEHCRGTQRVATKHTFQTLSVGIVLQCRAIHDMASVFQQHICQN